MQPDPRFLQQPKDFWAHVRTLSQHLGYTHRKSKRRPEDGVKVPTLAECLAGLEELELKTEHVAEAGEPTAFGELLLAYFEYRADVLNGAVEPMLMNVDEARRTFARLKKECKPRCPLPMNKQKGAKKAEAYFTGIINMLIEKHSEGLAVNYDPQELTTITRHGAPLRTLARRVDGAFTSAVNPVAVWEIKEYYYTTTFGSRVADGVYESLLDGVELEELREHEDIDVKHYLMIDARGTWWEKGKSYLCRIIDMLHMGYVDEALFGREVVDRLPQIVPEWVKVAGTQTEPTPTDS
jgi:hypothetical protein